ncbi:NADH-quinone oxidoreductase subunit A [Sulfurihydrogenibium sp.]|jgi:NADH-quinone oxidoreductase subunit A|uniref:NADH-quinone oxidoreductase subunit A n=1 Tax=Sulfurihydrogenibium sp. TaxID=2053621 RepID=UPI002603DC22|nr:NADH-quinone oxidoreductase subunit A [Sulfurihydrogenibium sp.]
MTTGYLGLTIFFILATAIGVVLLVVNRLLAPKTPEPYEGYPYECGVPLYDKTTWTTIDQKYYLLGLLLVLFDLESAFVFPWAVIFREVAQVAPGFILTEMFFFLGILILGYIYAWKKGALKWQ